MGDDKNLDGDGGLEDLVLPGGDDLEIRAIADDEDEGDFGLETDDRQAAEIRQIFGTTFPQYLLPVEEIVGQILTGEGDEDSTSALDGMLDSLLEASSRMGFDQVHRLLTELAESVAEIPLGGGPQIDAAHREAILGAIIDLKELAQEMGGGAAPEPQRTLVSALKNRPGIGQLVLKRLSAAGLVTVDQLLGAGPEEVAVVSGLDLKIVHEVIRALGSAEGRGAGAGVPSAVESLHDQVIRQLSHEVEAQAAADEAKVEVRRLRNRILERRVEIELLEEQLRKKKAELRKMSEQVMRQEAELDEARIERDLLARRYELGRSEQQQQSRRLATYREERRKLEDETLGLSREVGGLVDRLGRIRRSVARGRTK